MSTPTQSAAYASAVAAYTAVVNAATTQWIADATTLINTATTLGKFEVTIQSTPNISLADINTYFLGLGYTVFIPYCASGQPAELFGFYWDEYWQGRNVCNCKAKCSVRLTWGLPPSV